MNDSEALSAAPSSPVTGGVTREEAIQFLECACRNWSHIPKLQEDDLADVASELLRFVQKRSSSTGLRAENERLREALQNLEKAVLLNGDWDDGCFYHNGTSAPEFQRPLDAARTALNSEGR